MQKELFDKTKNIEDSGYAVSCRYDTDKIIVSKIKEGDVVLEIGCSTGNTLGKVQKITKVKSFGVDISSESIKQITDPSLEAVTVDLDKELLPYLDKKFDVVFSSHTIEHIIDTHKLMEESRRVLKDGGKLIVSCPNINTPLSWIIQIFLDLTPKGASRPYSAHYRDFSLKILCKTLELHGFKIVKKESLGMFIMNNLLTKAILFLFPRFGENLIVEALKIDRNQVPQKIYEDIRSL